ncbi:MAG: hypothetical protein ACLUQK_12530 [Clostridium sp.]
MELSLSLYRIPEVLNGLRTLLAGPIEDGMLGIGYVLYYAVPIIMTGLSVGLL